MDERQVVAQVELREVARPMKCIRPIAAQLITAGASELDAAEACILTPLSSDGAITDGLREVAVAAIADGQN